jgi:diguanylate cyclase (GGDEF)-like protein
MDRIDARHWLRVLWPHLALWAVLCTLVAGVTLWLIESGRQRELGDGRVEAENLARILQDQTARTFAGADVALSMLKALHERGVGDAFLAPVADSLARIPTTEVERVFSRFDADGRLAASSVRDAPIGQVSIADRAYFVEARDRAGPALHVSVPLMSRFLRAEVIPIAKRLDRPDGTFDGVVTMALDPARLVALFRSLRIGEASSIGLMHRDGRIYVASGGPTSSAVASPATTGEPLEAPGTTLAALAGESSIVATSPIPGTDIVAFAALSEDALLANHRVVARSLLGYAALIVLALTLPIALASKRAIVDAGRRRALELRYEDARERARTDPLTGVANREAFDSQLRASHQAAGDGVPFVLAFLDIDRFKALNDRHGHDTGDRALKRVADAMAGNVRRTDIVARMGGDEFAVLMPGADRASCLRVFDNLRETLRLVTLEEGWPISFSIGVVAFESAPARPRDAIALADRLMYDAKRSGRDGTRFATFRQGRLVVDAAKEPIAA